MLTGNNYKADIPHINSLKEINMDFLNYDSNLANEPVNYKRKLAYLESTYHYLP